MSLKAPHILLAGPNIQKIRTHLSVVLGRPAIALIDKEIERNVVGLFNLGLSHYAFARATAIVHWRQRISRFYYGAYNITRSTRLANTGEYAQDSSDHKRITELPTGMANKSTYENTLSVLRDDRNLCDYDHTATESDLVSPQADTEQLVADLITDARSFLLHRGVKV